MTDPASRLCLGSAQFGMDYGVANRVGVPSPAEIREIISVAYAGGVRWFDTAQTYGEAEQRLGEALRELGITRDVHVVSKLDPAAGALSRDDLQLSFEQSLNRLGLDSLGALMLHRPESLDGWGNGLGEFVTAARAAGAIGGFGVSVYRPADLDGINGRPEIQALQCPLNALDRRFADPALYSNGTRLFFRSVYLQGLLLLEPDEIQRKLPEAEGPVAQVRRFVEDREIGLKEFLLGVSLAAFPDSFVVLGVETVEQMRENLALLPRAQSDEVRSAVEDWVRQNRSFPDSVVNPTRWRTLA